MNSQALESAQVMSPVAPRVGTLLTPIASVESIMAAHDELAIVLKKCLTEGRDYGKIPGTERAALLKAGAETLAKAFGLYPSFEIIASDIDHDHEFKWAKKQKVWANKFRGDKDFTWKVEEGIGYGLYRYVVKCSLILRHTGEIVGTGTGTCSSMESKYIDRPRDCENTILKMAEKRAMVGAVLTTFGLSDRFDSIEEDAEEAEAKSSAAAQPAPVVPNPVVQSEPPTPAQRLTKIVGDGNVKEFQDTAIAAEVSWIRVISSVKDTATVEEAFAKLHTAIEEKKAKDAKENVTPEGSAPSAANSVSTAPAHAAADQAQASNATANPSSPETPATEPAKEKKGKASEPVMGPN